MKNTAVAIVSLLLMFPSISSAQSTTVLHLSHDATVRVFSQSGNSSGTGFMVGDRLVLTCLHVVSRTQIDANGVVTGMVFKDLQVAMPSGEVLSADVVSSPTPAEPDPLRYDFSYLKLRSKPQSAFQKLSFAKEKDLEAIDLGDDVVFSGYPLNTPAMLTHKGMISGTTNNKDLICIQASVNKGNSGGALLNKDGKIVGIISLREGGIAQGLAKLRQQIDGPQQIRGTVFGIDPIASTKMLIDTLDEYISVGIGYALNAKFSLAYLGKHPELNN